MAKISARGAREVLRAEIERRGTRFIYVLCSDGRMLSQAVIPGPYGVHRTGYTVVARGVTPQRFREIVRRIDGGAAVVQGAR